MKSLLDWQASTGNAPRPSKWRPKPLTTAEWPPDYAGVYRWRAEVLKGLLNDPQALAAAKTYYSNRPTEFILDWMDTYDPRLAGNKWVPFVFFQKQAEFVDFLRSLDRDQESGLIEKSRDMGATWASCAYSVWCWLFIANDATGWGSRKESLVDKLGDPDSLFEKMRLLIKRLPMVFVPDGFTWTRHSTFMKLVNPENGAIIAGEAGDNIGRGGRKSRYFKDESAHYERPELIEAALGDNTNVQIDISSVNGLGNVFHRRREHGVNWVKGADLPRGFTRVFIMDWRDHPRKDQVWYDTRKAKYEREGMLHIFAQEVDRNYSAAVSNTVIPYEWLQACVDAHIQVPYFAAACTPERLGRWVAGLDVADQGVDRNALTLREWVIWRDVQEWGERDPGVTARRAIIACRPYRGRVECQYDCIGVGAGVKSEYNRLTQDDDVVDAAMIPFVPWNAGSSVLKPFEKVIPDDDESIKNKDFFENLKAQAWWSMRTRAYKTWKARTEGVVYPVDELLSLDSRMELLQPLLKELAQPTRGQSGRLKMLIEKQPNGAKSPNLADSGIMAFFPLDAGGPTVEVSSYGH